MLKSTPTPTPSWKTMAVPKLPISIVNLASATATTGGNGVGIFRTRPKVACALLLVGSSCSLTSRSKESTNFVSSALDGGGSTLMMSFRVILSPAFKDHDQPFDSATEGGGSGPKFSRKDTTA